MAQNFIQEGISLRLKNNLAESLGCSWEAQKTLYTKHKNIIIVMGIGIRVVLLLEY